MFFRRVLAPILEHCAKFPIIALLGPRQSGKTTLVKNVFKEHIYVSLEDPRLRELAINNPQKFLRDYENAHGIILDEFQYVPQLLSYIQLYEKKKPGYFILTGSQNFLMNTSITQSLAGRVGILTLLPFSQKELIENNLSANADELILRGAYPSIYSENILHTALYPSYIQTYIERDIRQLINVGNLRTFQTFMRLCAGRVGQLLNLADLATTCGITRKTAEKWLSTLTASYIIFLLKPHVTNFKKRITSTPKLYFYDTGLACSLLGIRLVSELKLSHFRSHLFKDFVIADLHKQYFNMGIEPPLYFWRDKNGEVEVDCIIDLPTKLIPIEIKSGETIAGDFFDGLTKWNALAQTNPEDGYIIYAGNENQSRTRGHIIGWQTASNLITKIEKERANLP